MSNAGKPTFEELLRRVRSGDRAAAGELWQQFEAEIRRTLRVRLWQSGLRGREETEDRLQSVALLFFDRLDRGKLDQRLDELQTPEELLNLLKQMAQGKYVDWIRRRSAQRRGEQKKRSLEALEFEPAADETRASQALQQRELVQQGLALLDAHEQRIAELLRTGYHWQQIADQLGTTREAVRKQFYHAVDRLRARLFGSTNDDFRRKGTRRR
jgi:RNA polymerase sigma factor (sigma-70 family)